MNTSGENDRPSTSATATGNIKEKTKVPVWEHFQIISKDSAKCNYCKKTLQTKFSSTSGLIRHIKSGHPNIFSKLQINISKQNEQKATKKTECLKTQAVNAMYKHLVNRPSNISSHEHKTICNLVSEMICTSYLPYEFVESYGFKKLMDHVAPSFKIPCRTTFSRNLIPTLYNQCKNEAKQSLTKVILEGLPSLAFTCDLWTSRANDSFISLTCHFTNNDMSLERMTLETSYFPSSHTGDAIYDKISTMKEDWDIPKQKIPIYIVADNARNIQNAISRDKWISVPCFAHSLQLAISDAKKETNGVAEICSKARAIVGHYGRSPSATSRLHKIQQDLGNKEHKLIQDVETRWNSEYLMLEQLLEQKEAVSAELVASSANVDNLTQNEWKMAKSISEILKPVYQATVEISSELLPTISTVIPIVHLIDIHCKTYIHENQGQHCAGLTFARSLVKSLLSRFANVRSDPTYSLAMFLDPRFKDIVFSNIEQIHLASILDNKVSTLSVNNSDLSVDLTDYNTVATEGTNGKRDFWSSFDVIVEERSSSEISELGTVKSEIMKYKQLPPINRKCNPCLWWKDNRQIHPNLFTLAREYLGIPATSVASERVFSAAGNVITDLRHNLTPEHAEQQTFLHDYFLNKSKKNS